MNRRTTKVVLALALATTLIGSGVSPAVAQQLPAKAKVAEASISSHTSTPDAVESEMPETMTDEEMDAWEAGLGTSDSRRTETTRAAVGDSCKLVPGRMWKRSSGKGFPHGGVGSKPALTSCTAGVVKTTMTSQVYMHNGWLWVKKGGASRVYGHGNMTDKNVMYVCANVNSNSFKVATLGTGTNAAGAYHESTDSTGTYVLGCG